MKAKSIIFKWIGNILIVFLVIVGISTLYSVYLSKNDPSKTPSVFGYHVLTVLSGSMSPQLEAGDLLITKKTAVASINVSDVISYKSPTNTMVTHRVIDIVNQNGELFFQTKGDANNIEDQALVSSDQLVGSLTFNIPKAGYVMNFLKTPLGLISIIAVIFIFLTFGFLKELFNPSEKKRIEDIHARLK